MLGSYYEKQLARQEISEQKMAERANRVNEQILAPTLKDLTQQRMLAADHAIIDADVDTEGEKKQKLAKLQSRKNLDALTDQMAQKRLELQIERDAPIAPKIMQSVQTAPLWSQVEENLKQFKRDS